VGKVRTDMDSPIANIDAVVFDLGGVLIDWNPRYLYRQLFPGDVEGMERFLSEVCTSTWNERQDAGRPGKKRSTRPSPSIRSTRL